MARGHPAGRSGRDEVQGDRRSAGYPDWHCDVTVGAGKTADQGVYCVGLKCEEGCRDQAMNCEQREKTGLYVDGELEPSAQHTFAAHLENCNECSAAVLEQQELKKAVRVAAKRFSAPPELYAAARKQMSPPSTRLPWWKAVLVAACLVTV